MPSNCTALLSIATLAVAAFPPSRVAAQETPSTATVSANFVRVEGVPKPLKFTAADLAGLPRQTVRAKDHSGKESLFEGVSLSEVLVAAGVKLGNELRGPALANYVLVEAADGYRVVFALPELDPASTDRVILLADRRDGQPLDAKEGPFRIVVPNEKRHSRWVRQVAVLTLKRA
jgi:hypothetical protein